MTDEQQRELRDLDLEFNSSKTMDVETYSRKRAEILERAPQAQSPDAPLTKAKAVKMFRLFGETVAKLQAENQSALVKRIAALEERLKAAEARGGGVSIIASAEAIPALTNLSTVMQKLDETLKMPMRPVYGPTGLLVGARRVASLEDEDEASATRPRGNGDGRDAR